MFGCLADNVICGSDLHVKSKLKEGHVGIWITPTDIKTFDLEKLRQCNIKQTGNTFTQSSSGFNLEVTS
jgi:hypothetical protein